MNPTKRQKSSREKMLERIRTALKDVADEEQAGEQDVERDYIQHSSATAEEIVARFIERVVDYKATVHHINENALVAEIERCCSAHSLRRLVVAGDISPTWIPDGVEALREDGASDVPLSYAQLDASDGVLTGCALGIAQTGTIVLDGGAMQGRRVLTLLPDYALCLIWERQIIDLVPEAIQQLASSMHTRPQPLTFVSGPSATSDIELSRVEGVHGPRTLEVIVVRSN